MILGQFYKIIGFVGNVIRKLPTSQQTRLKKYNSGAPGHRNGVVGSCGFNIRDDAATEEK